MPEIVMYFDEQKIAVVDAVCGWYHCGVISDAGELYMWGYNYNAICGRSPP